MADEPQVTLGWNLPAPASWKEMEELLADVLLSVSRGDSWEGTITWVMPTDEPWLEDADCGVVARYRVGNAEHGQGFLRAYTKDVPESKLMIEGGPNGESLKRSEHDPGMFESVKLAKFLASLDTDEERRRTITLQEVIEMAKGTYQP